MKETLTFDAVYARHIPYVRRVLQQLGVRSGDLDDVVQDTFVAVHRQLPAFEGRAALETWLHAICWRVAAGYHRRARTRRKVAGATELHSDDSLGEQSVLPAVDRLLALLETVDTGERDLFALHEVGGLSIAELAELTGMARATVRRRIEGTRTQLGRRSARGFDPRLAEGPPATVPSSAPEQEVPGFATDYATPNIGLARRDNVVIIRWRGSARVPELETLFALMRRTAEVSPQGILHLSCNEPTSGPPDGPARDAIRRFTADIDNGMKAAAFTTRSQGWFRILPPIINTCLFLSGKRYKTRFCNEERPVFEWLAQYTTVTADEMQDACDDLRRLIDEAELAAESVRAKEQPWATA